MLFCSHVLTETDQARNFSNLVAKAKRVQFPIKRGVQIPKRQKLQKQASPHNLDSRGEISCNSAIVGRKMENYVANNFANQ